MLDASVPISERHSLRDEVLAHEDTRLMLIEKLYRYPVKGLSAEPMQQVSLTAGKVFPWDRSFALAQGDAAFDPTTPTHLPKHNYMCLMRNERVAAIRSAFNPDTGELALATPCGSFCREDVLSEAGRERTALFLTTYLGPQARGTPKFHHVPGHAFTDVKQQFVSLINLDTLAEYERRIGASRHPMRFRANICFSGIEPWAEFELLDRRIEVGSAVLHIRRRTPRCPATQVNPETATRDADPVKELRAAYGHFDLGVYAEVVEGGTICVGDALRLCG